MAAYAAITSLMGTMHLLSQSRRVTNEVENEVESQVLLMMEKNEHIRTEAKARLLMILQQTIPHIDYVKEDLSKQRKNNKLQAARNGSIGGSCSPRSDVSTIENNVVGYNIEQELMLRQLTGHSSQMEVISIVGMGGIDKLSELWIIRN
ncbi:hypothetical protein KY290_033469 [Solanum tuberosum]|uniref:Uncharacterized protein n=1 Tax=Solanum tuberosum TaxID=4113 RepID=A0ABQ7U0E1_SOLTU|nr:hypothetical protein KY285_032714 [Solanum tuberosum]KAH0740426.1 hypothetical protein KY290_033469 [Solanum tuberosum]